MLCHSDILPLINFNQCKFYSGNIYTGFPALYCNAWIYSFDCQYTCASNGWHPCKFLSTVSYFDLYWISFWWIRPLISGIQCWHEQGDKARVIQTLLFMAGLNTLVQTVIGTRLPTVMTASFAYVIPVLAIINDLSDETFASEHQVFKFQAVCNMRHIFAISLLRVLGAIWFCVWKRLCCMDYLLNLTIYELLSTNVWENAPNLYV